MPLASSDEDLNANAEKPNPFAALALAARDIKMIHRTKKAFGL